MDFIIEQISGHIIEFICIGVLTAVAVYFKKVSKLTHGIVLSVKAQGHDKLYRFCEFYISSNQITVRELENLRHIYEGYVAVGGNGTAKELYERCQDLPIVDKRTVYNPYYTERHSHTQPHD